MTEFEDSYKEFMNKIDLTSDAKGNFDKSTFFKEYESVFSENKVIANLDEAYYASTGMEVSGYSIDTENKCDSSTNVRS